MSGASAMPPVPQANASPAPLPSPVSASPVAPTAPCERANLPDAALVLLAQAGETEAAEILLCRHLAAFRRRAERLCEDPTEAQDICQDALIKAISRLPELRNGGAFHVWVLGFISNEARNWRRNLRKLGTPLNENDPSIIESMSVRAPDHSAADLKYLEGLLRRQTRRIEGPCRPTATFMLKYYAREQQFPPVRTIAEATKSSHGAAQRCRESALQAWRRTLAAFDLHP